MSINAIRIYIPALALMADFRSLNNDESFLQKSQIWMTKNFDRTPPVLLHGVVSTLE